jgi:hypothetical protein
VNGSVRCPRPALSRSWQVCDSSRRHSFAASHQVVFARIPVAPKRGRNNRDVPNAVVLSGANTGAFPTSWLSAGELPVGGRMRRRTRLANSVFLRFAADAALAFARPAQLKPDTSGSFGL